MDILSGASPLIWDVRQTEAGPTLGWTEITVRCVPAGKEPELIFVEAARFDGYRRDVKVELAGGTTALVQAWATPTGRGDRPEDGPVRRGCLDDIG